MEEAKSIIFELETADGKQFYQFSSKILIFNIETLNNNHSEPYPLPIRIINSIRPLEAMSEFVKAHNYDPQSFRIVKPLKSSNYSEIVDGITFKIFSKYCDQQNSAEACEIIKFAKYIRFHQLSDAVCAAVATNYYIDEDERSLDQFIKKNKLQDVSSEDICEIIKLYEDTFKLIEHKAKQELLQLQQK